MNDQIAELIVDAAHEQLLVDVSRHATDRIHEVIKMHAMSLPDVRLAIALGLSVSATIAAETVQFAMNSMEGDDADERAIRSAAILVLQAMLEDLGTIEPSRPTA